MFLCIFSAFRRKNALLCPLLCRPIRVHDDNCDVTEVSVQIMNNFNDWIRNALQIVRRSFTHELSLCVFFFISIFKHNNTRNAKKNLIFFSWYMNERWKPVIKSFFRYKSRSCLTPRVECMCTRLLFLGRLFFLESKENNQATIC